jgi:endoglucanase
VSASPESAAPEPKEDFPEVLGRLLRAHGPSGHETAPAAAWRDAAESFATSVSVDVVGTPSAVVAPRAASDASAQRRLIVMGHIDEIGLIVTHIDEQGFLWFREVGGWDPQILVGQRVVLATRSGEVPGVIGRKPIHLLREEDRKKVAEIRDLHIDIGASDEAQARELVRVGDVAVIDGDPLELPGARIASRALDNRLGSFVALEAARIVAEGGGANGWEFVAVAATQEETTFGGSRTSAFSLEPDAAIVVDVTHATDAPGIDVKEAGKHELGSGPVLCRGSTLHPAIFELMHETATHLEMPFTVEASGRNTGTDADAVHLSRGGVPTGLVSIPLRYMHSPVELVALSDVHACARLIAATALALDADTRLAR